MAISYGLRVLCRCVPLVCAIAATMPTHAAAEVRLDEKSSLRIFSTNQGPVAEIVAAKPTAVSLDAHLRGALAKAQEYFVVGRRPIHESGHVYLLVITQTPSREGGRSSYCGAGTEDVIHLVELVAMQRRLIQRGSMLLQSCLSSLSLSDDSGRSLRKQFESIEDPHRLSITWLGHPTHDSGPKVILIRRGALTTE